MKDTIYREDAIEAVRKIVPVETEIDATLLDKMDVIVELSELPSADAEPSLKAIKRQIDEHWYLDPPSAEAVQGWILCSERLPETHTEYVTENPWMQVSITEDTYQLSEPVLGYGKRKHHSNGDPMMSVVWYEDDGYGRTGWTTAPDCEDIDVIAWMPLPEPYKGGDDE